MAYRGGLTDGKNDGYDEGYSHGYVSGRDESSAAYAASLKEMSDQCMRTELLLSREPQDRYTLLAIAEKLKLAAETFRAVRSESQATTLQQQQQHAKATKELRALTRYSKEFDRQLKALIGYEALRQLHKATDNALLLADLVREAA